LHFFLTAGVSSLFSSLDFLITNYGTVKLADFGLARIYNPQWMKGAEKLSHQVSTRQYRAPELLYASRTYNEKVDIWSIAVIMIELILLKTLFPSHNDIDQMCRVFQIVGSPSPANWPVSSFEGIKFVVFIICFQEVEQLPDYGKVSFASFVPVPLSVLRTSGHPEDINFIENFFQLNSSKRLSAKDGLGLPYFHSDLSLTSLTLVDFLLSSSSASSSAKSKRKSKLKVPEKLIKTVEEFLEKSLFK
jgi:cell cycle related kinase